MSRLILAPMEGLADYVLRDVLTRASRYDWCVTEFVRVSGTLLPLRVYTRTCPEVERGSRTYSGTPVRVQFLGSDPACLAANAAQLVQLNPAGIDLNFGCPAPTVNRHRGGAALLEEPKLLESIVAAVRGAVPKEIPVTAKMRIGLTDTAYALESAQALAAGGADELVVHGRTKVDGYRPPARWEWIGRIREAVNIPVIANGEVWNVADWRSICAESGCADVMIGRGAVADPFLVSRIKGERDEQVSPDDWIALCPLIAEFWLQVLAKVHARHAPGRLKQWLGSLQKNYPEAAILQKRIRELRTVEEVNQVLVETLNTKFSMPEEAHRMALAA